MHLFVDISLALLALYFVFLLYLVVNITFHRETKQAEEKNGAPGISIVVPFKNEAAHLPALLDTLMHQDYSGPYEILLVNDESTDTYEKIVIPYCLSAPHPVKIIPLKYDTAIHLTSKQQALDAGVAQASYEWLLFTDADMEFESNWIASMARMVSYGHDMVFGHTVLRKKGKRKFFNALQSFQLEFLFAVAYAFQASKLTGSCMGNNLLVKKKSYRSIGGQIGVGYSIVEDCDLLRAFKRKGFSVTAVSPFVPAAYTFPSETFTDLSNQAMRWARGGLRLKTGLLPILVLFFFQNVLFVLSCAQCVPQQIEIVSFANAALTIVFIYGSFKKIHSAENILFLPVYYFFLMIETCMFMATAFLAPGISWKDRKI